MDDRLAWNSSNYSGVQTITGHKFDFYLHDLWLPTLHLADMPGSAKQQDLFKNHDVDIVIHKSGTVRASIKALITTPCYFGFGDYPNDYQNCTFTLMSPYFADAFQFSDWGGFAYSKYLLEDRISDVQDFMLINVDSHRYFMYLGMDVVENIGTLPPGYCRGFYRYVLTLKRMNKLVFSQLTAPMIVIIVLMTIAGFLPNRYGLPVLLATLGIELMFTISMTDVLPDNFNGMPNIGNKLKKTSLPHLKVLRILAILLVIETMVLTAWKVFSIYTRNNRRLRVVKRDQIYQMSYGLIESYGRSSVKMGRRVMKNVEWNSTITKNRSKKEGIPRINDKKEANKINENQKLMELAKKLVINHPDLTLEQAIDIETRRQAARKKREEEVTIDASIHLRIDQEMEEYLMMENEEDDEKENSEVTEMEYQVNISIKLNQLELSNGDGLKDKNKIMN
ncbi:hypothetical protein CRE_21030 [Caenorhabditis remanei]|uniref:Neurotransmitter-gated ion-channel ligand-binding domain-containing protein n=1 Tax=Caenorhabditis remanei TaxID=31234 RepID=E3NN65_CAERE|nr:hypothetical protein CRE_21030 [Caenorhabditis remanei]